MTIADLEEKRRSVLDFRAERLRRISSDPNARSVTTEEFDLIIIPWRTQLLRVRAHTRSFSHLGPAICCPRDLTIYLSQFPCKQIYPAKGPLYALREGKLSLHTLSGNIKPISLTGMPTLCLSSALN